MKCVCCDTCSILKSRSRNIHHEKKEPSFMLTFNLHDPWKWKLIAYIVIRSLELTRYWVENNFPVACSTFMTVALSFRRLLTSSLCDSSAVIRRLLTSSLCDSSAVVPTVACVILILQSICYSDGCLRHPHTTVNLSFLRLLASFSYDS